MNAKNELLKSLFPQIINHFASQNEMELEDAMDLFYKSKTYVKLCGDNDFYAKGIDYIVNELENEYLTFH